MEAKKILIVEDEKPLAHALELKLKSSGYDITLAGNGDDALTALAGTKFDLVLTDIMMPKRDGFSVLEEVKKQGAVTPVFVMSNLGQDEDMQRAKALGAADYITKSTTTLAEIVERITTFLAKEPEHAV